MRIITFCEHMSVGQREREAKTQSKHSEGNTQIVDRPKPRKRLLHRHDKRRSYVLSIILFSLSLFPFNFPFVLLVYYLFIGQFILFYFFNCRWGGHRSHLSYLGQAPTFFHTQLAISTPSQDLVIIVSWNTLHPLSPPLSLGLPQQFLHV